MDITTLIAELQQLGTPKRALWDQRYHKSKREHWGVSAPNCHHYAKQLSQRLSGEELLSLAKSLWDTDLFDPMICAAKLLNLRCVPPSNDLWEMILYFLKKVDGWALEDQLAPVAWKCILSNPHLLNELEEWTTHSNFWIRRAALVYTLPFAKKGRDPEQMLGWASKYTSDTEWFIQKAIGWWLRVLGAHNPARVVLFANEHWPSMKGVARKEATRKLSPEWRAKIPFN